MDGTRAWRAARRVFWWRSRVGLALTAAVDSAIALIYALLLGIVVPLSLPGPSFTTPGFAPLNRWLGGHEDIWLGLGIALLLMPLPAVALRDLHTLIAWRLLLALYSWTLTLSFLIGNPRAFGWTTYGAIGLWCAAQAGLLAWRAARMGRAGRGAAHDG